MGRTFSEWMVSPLVVVASYCPSVPCNVNTLTDRFAVLIAGYFLFALAFLFKVFVKYVVLHFV